MRVDPRMIQSAVDTRLPIRARWMLRETPLDFEFFSGSDGPRRLNNGDVGGGDLPAEWVGFLAFGRYDFAEGGGASPWIAVRDGDGEIYGLDIERRREITFKFNSSLDRFIATFNLLGQHLREGRALPPAILSDLRAADEDAFDASEWRILVEHVTAT